MFTIDIILGMLKKLVSFLWEYKFIILTAVIITVLYIRGNNYKQDYESEAVAHVKTVLEYNQQINDIRIANEQALRIAQEESAANYKELVEKTQGIQEKYNEQNETINTTVNRINNSNNSLLEQIRTYSSDSYSSSGESVRNTSDADRIQKLSESLESCVGRKQFYAEDAAKLQNSVTTLQEWGNMIIENSKQTTSKGDKDE